MDKKTLRIKAKEIRKQLDITTLSKILTNKLTESHVYKNASNIMLYYPLENEINLLEIIKDKNKNFYLPKINGNELLCCPYKAEDKTCLSRFNTCEPMTEPCKKDLIDLIIVPAIACDKNNFRLGYGGGFYDRFLKDFNGTKITCIPAALLFDTIFPEVHDIKMDIVITEI